MNRFRSRHIVLPVLFGLLLMSGRTSAQQRNPEPLFGPFVAYEYGLPLALERTPGNVEWCTFCDGTGSSFDHRGRFGAFLQFFSRRNFFADLRLSLGISSGLFTSNSYTAPLADPVSGNAVQTNREFTVSALTARLGAEGQIKGRVVGDWHLGFGPWIEYWLLSRFVHKESILSPTEISFPENSERTRVVAEGDLLGSGPVSFGGTLSASHELPFSSRFRIIPELYTRVDAWGLVNGLGLRSFSVGIDFAFGRHPVPSPGPPVLLLPSPPIPPPPLPAGRLSAEIDLYAMDADGNRWDEIRLLPRRTLHRRRTSPTREWIVEDYVLPSIGVTPGISADAGLRSWSLSIRRDGREIARITSDDEDQSLDLEIDLADGTVPSRLTAELIAEDSTGAMTAARDDLPFVEVSPEEPPLNRSEQDVIEEQWLLFPPEEGEGSLTREGISVLEEFAREAKGTPSEIVLVPGSERLLRSAETYREYLRNELPDREIIIETDRDGISLPAGEELPGKALLLLRRHPWNKEN